MWCYLKVRITCIIAGINFKLLFLFWFSYLAAPLSDLIFFNFIFCLPPSIHSHAHLRRLKFFQLWTITAPRNCEVVKREHLPTSRSFFKNGRCILYGQSLHSNVVMRLKPFFTVPTCWRIIWGREKWRLGCHFKWSSIAPAPSMPFLCKPPTVRDLRLHDILYAHHRCGWRIGIELVASAEQ